MKNKLNIGLTFILILLTIGAMAQVTKRYKPPLYFNPYEMHISLDHDKVPSYQNTFTYAEWKNCVDVMATKLKPFGYDMFCTDGWGDDWNLVAEGGYRRKFSSSFSDVQDFAAMSAYLKSKGMTLGVYNNPLWVPGVAIEYPHTFVGVADTSIKVSSLYKAEYKGTHSYGNFNWVDIENPYAENWIKNYVAYYGKMGVSYLRADFLSWYEDGKDKNLGDVGYNQGRTRYEKALKIIGNACEEYNMMFSMVMPHMKNEGDLERKYGHLGRINADVDNGGWHNFSDKNRGNRSFDQWSQYENMFDGMIYWSKYTGKNGFIPDGDFTRLNTMGSDDERRSIVTLQLVAGAPLCIGDLPVSMGGKPATLTDHILQFYTNKELLALNADWFSGKPLSHDVSNNHDSQVWTGQLSNGDIVVAFFNREGQSEQRAVSFAAIKTKYGVDLSAGGVYINDLWNAGDANTLYAGTSYSKSVSSHGCHVVRFTTNNCNLTAQTLMFDAVPYKYIGSAPFTVKATSSAALAISNYSIVSGPATISGQTITLTGQSGIVKVKAEQNGNATYCPGNATLDIPVGSSQYQSSQTKMYVAGSFTATPWTGRLKMNLVSDNNWVSDSVQLAGGNYEIKFTNETNWANAGQQDWGNATGLSGTAKLTTGGGANVTFTIASTDYYQFVFNDKTYQYSIRRTGTVTGVNTAAAEEESIQIYPTPASDKLKVSLGEFSTAKIEVISISGAVLYSEEATSPIHEIDVTGLGVKGIAFVRVTTNTKTRTFKAIIQ